MLLQGGCLLLPPPLPTPTSSPVAAISPSTPVTVADVSYICPDFLHILWVCSSVLLEVVLVLLLLPATSTSPWERRPRLLPPAPLLVVTAAVEKGDANDKSTEDVDGDGSGFGSGITFVGASPSMSLSMLGRSVVGWKGGIRVVEKTHVLSAGE